MLCLSNNYDTLSLQVLVIDELCISANDKKKLKSGETSASELEETLAWLANNTAMTLAALSSTSLLDRDTAVDHDVSQTS